MLDALQCVAWRREADALVLAPAARRAGWALARKAFGASGSRRGRRPARDARPETSGKFFRDGVFRGRLIAAHLWVNATPLGMHISDRSPAPKSLPPPEAAIDLVYVRRTAFQRDASVRGARVEDGAPMPGFQALRAW